MIRLDVSITEILILFKKVFELHSLRAQSIRAIKLLVTAYTFQAQSKHGAISVSCLATMPWSLKVI